MIAFADVAVSVSNAETTARWWKEKLGFHEHRLGGSTHPVLVAPPGDPFLLHLCEGFEPVEPGNTGIAFMTDNIESMVASMERAGVKFPEPLDRSAGGGMAKFADPDGNIFWLLGAPRSFIDEQRGQRAPDTPPE